MRDCGFELGTKWVAWHGVACADHAWHGVFCCGLFTKHRVFPLKVVATLPCWHMLAHCHAGMQARELEELAQIYVARGLPYELARQVAVVLTEKDVIRAHARDELGIGELLLLLMVAGCG